MSSVSKAIKKVVRRFMPKEAGSKAGIDFLNQGGFLRERFDTIAEMDEKSYIEQDSKYTTTTLPWLDIRKVVDHFERNDAFMDNLSEYQELITFIEAEKLKMLTDYNTSIMEENVRRRLNGEELVPLFTLHDLKDVPMDSDLEGLKLREEQILTWMAKVNLGLSFDNPDDNKTLVLEKQVIMEQAPEVKEIYRLLREAMGADKYGKDRYPKGE